MKKIIFSLLVATPFFSLANENDCQLEIISVFERMKSIPYEDIGKTSLRHPILAQALKDADNIEKSCYIALPGGHDVHPYDLRDYAVSLAGGRGYLEQSYKMQLAKICALENACDKYVQRPSDEDIKEFEKLLGL